MDRAISSLSSIRRADLRAAADFVDLSFHRPKKEVLGGTRAVGLSTRTRRSTNLNGGLTLIAAIAVLICGCTHLSPLHKNSVANPTQSLIAGAGYELAFVEFGEQGSYQDTTQLQNAVSLIKRTSRPLVITYVHG